MGSLRSSGHGKRRAPVPAQYIAAQTHIYALTHLSIWVHTWRRRRGDRPPVGTERIEANEHQPSQHHRKPHPRSRAPRHRGRHPGALVRHRRQRSPKEPADRRVGGLSQLHRLYHVRHPRRGCRPLYSKGSKVAIEGKLRYSSWERDGQKRSKLEVIVDEIEFMNSRPAASPAAAVDGGQQYAVPEAPAVEVADEDIPF